MENQHRQIMGYRELTGEEVAAIHSVKALGAQVGAQVGELVEALQEDVSSDPRWVAIARTHLQEGFMALVRAIAKPTTFVLAGLVLAGCVSPYQQPDGSFLVTKHSEVRSPFGTNGGFDFLERCQGPERVVLFYTEGDFTNCQPVLVDSRSAFHKASQGQGGQILEGAMNAGALGALAATKTGGTAAANAGAVVIQSTSVAVGKGRR